MTTRRSTRNKKVTGEEPVITKIKTDRKKEKYVDEKQDSQEPPTKKSKAAKKNSDVENADKGSEDSEWQNAKSIYEFKAKAINGDDVSLDKYKGHVCIVVNVASKCGHTKSNYEQFVELFDKYSSKKGLRILAFPCNQFGKQEPGDLEKICEFAKKRNVKFDMFEKVEVNGKNAHPLWKYLTLKLEGPKGKNIDWNFTKFIIDADGQVVERHKSSVKPLQMVQYLEKYW